MPEPRRRLAPPHPWHHAMFCSLAGVEDGEAFASLPEARASGISGVVFVSATTAQPYAQLDASYWREWLTTPVNFKGALEYAACQLCVDSCYVIEMGAHPVLIRVAAETLRTAGVSIVAVGASMRRDQPNGFWAAQRAAGPKKAFGSKSNRNL